ncbi:hypothetical protein ACTNE5_05345 [Acidaminococcus fermentans]
MEKVKGSGKKEGRRVGSKGNRPYFVNGQRSAADGNQFLQIDFETA